MQRPHLIAVSGPLQGHTILLDGARRTIGRQAESDLQLLDIAVSRCHCELVQTSEAGGEHWLIRDLDSRYGTFVNGQPVRERELAHGDLVQVAGTLLLFLMHEASESPAAPPVLADHLLVMQSTVQRRLDENPFLQLSPPSAAAPELAPAALLRLCVAAQEARDVAALGQAVLEQLFTALPAACGSVLLVEQLAGEAPGPIAAIAGDAAVAPGELRAVATRPAAAAGAGGPGGAGGDGAPRVSRTVLARVLREQLGLLCADVAADPALGAADSLGGHGGSSLLCAPLVGRGRVLGAIYLEATAALPFAERHLDLAMAAAAVAALALENLATLQWLRGENRRLRGGGSALQALVGESAVMKRLHALLARVGATSSTVLIRGESGTGKELCAQAIHAASSRAEGPFVAINCATLSDTLLESELFGHEKGAFTGAVARKIGKVELAHEGTLFLDEIGELPLGMQARLLRVLQEREIDRVGGTRPIAVNVRIVAATNRDLEAAMRAGRFREDLFYRLNVVTLATPALRERRDDILLLARHFARACAERVGRRVVGISEAARAALVGYDWPGNVRQLGNAIERALVLGSDEVIQLDDLPEEVLAARPPAEEPAAGAGDFHDAILATKRRLITEAYERADHDHQRAAALLGVHANSLHRLIRNLGLKTELGKERD